MALLGYMGFDTLLVLFRIAHTRNINIQDPFSAIPLTITAEARSCRRWFLFHTISRRLNSATMWWKKSQNAGNCMKLGSNDAGLGVVCVCDCVYKIEWLVSFERVELSLIFNIKFYSILMRSNEWCV